MLVWARLNHEAKQAAFNKHFFLNTNPFVDSKRAKNLEEQTYDAGTQSNSEVGSADDEPAPATPPQDNADLDFVAPTYSVLFQKFIYFKPHGNKVEHGLNLMKKPVKCTVTFANILANPNSQVLSVMDVPASGEELLKTTRNFISIWMSLLLTKHHLSFQPNDV